MEKDEKEGALEQRNSGPVQSTIGTEGRNESERRYGQLSPESKFRGRHGEREREYQEGAKGIPEQERTATAAQEPGSTSKTEGAFGIEAEELARSPQEAQQQAKQDVRNLRYRREAEPEAKR